MQDDNKKDEIVEEGQQDNAGAEVYIDEIKKLKSNSVSKEEYGALLEERNKLVKALVDGDEVDLSNDEDSDTEANVLDDEISNLRKDLLNEDSGLSNLEYWTKALALRDKLIEKDGEEADPFLPNSSQVDVTEQDKQAVERVVSTVKDCIETANGDEAAFVALMTARIKDDPISKANAKRK